MSLDKVRQAVLKLGAMKKLLVVFFLLAVFLSPSLILAKDTGAGNSVLPSRSAEKSRAWQQTVDQKREYLKEKLGLDKDDDKDEDGDKDDKDKDEDGDKDGEDKDDEDKDKKDDKKDDRKDGKKEELRQKASARIKKILEKILNRLERRIERLAKINQKADERIAKLKKAGKDVSKAETNSKLVKEKLALAKTDLGTAGAALAAFDETKPRESAETVKAALKKVRVDLTEAHKAMKETVTILKLTL